MNECRVVNKIMCTARWGKESQKSGEIDVRSSNWEVRSNYGRVRCTRGRGALAGDVGGHDGGRGKTKRKVGGAMWWQQRGRLGRGDMMARVQRGAGAMRADRGRSVIRGAPRGRAHGAWSGGRNGARKKKKK